MPNKISILSTRPLDNALIEEAKQVNLEIDTLSFIETEPIDTIEVLQEIQNALLQTAAVVFTSMNAVEAVARQLHGQQPDWRIYSIGTTTSKRVTNYFGEDSIAGTADSARELAELIVEESVEDEIIFFCGDQRRDELPDILRNHEIEVSEITVYETIQVAHKLAKKYAGILFFSPSAVSAFFSVNKPGKETVLFAIGNTTAKAIKNYTDNKIIIADQPGKEELVRQAMEYFS